MSRILCLSQRQRVRERKRSKAKMVWLNYVYILLFLLNLGFLHVLNIEVGASDLFFLIFLSILCSFLKLFFVCDLFFPWEKLGIFYALKPKVANVLFLCQDRNYKLSVFETLTDEDHEVPLLFFSFFSSEGEVTLSLKVSFFFFGWALIFIYFYWKWNFVSIMKNWKPMMDPIKIQTLVGNLENNWDSWVFI